ncbi:MAG: nickel pincer cofactor biosynthesis protein LarC [Desulfocapsaceae bacterium]|nr:nickel pincer cofactor biosynthesis protein LarC [Desulfocapsaceae bacterium]
MSSSPRIAYADCFSGISGDMFLGALLHCGFPEEVLRQELAKIDIGEFSLSISTPTICGIGSCRAHIEPGSSQQNFRNLESIGNILNKSSLDGIIIERSLAVFTELARAEAKVHNTEPEKIHFHEVGAVDTIIDIVGTIVGLHHLGIEKLIAAPVPQPRGFVKCAHGTLPLPAPAVCEILRGVPCYGVDCGQELVTPTGAALLKVLSDEFSRMPAMIISSTGYGAGSHVLPDNQPNLFRLIVGTSVEVAEYQEVEVIETNIDDYNTEGFPYLLETLIGQGALDVSLTPLQVKKGRPGFGLQVIAPLHLAMVLRETIFSETSAIGLRYRREHRQTLPREIIEVETPWGKLKAKQVSTPGGSQIYPEYEECRRVALANNISLRAVYEAVRNRSNLR